ncbi:hypothetical protein FEK35_07205 [Nocardia cyriacigeorgica]|uniref:Uncharacterized protein n=1 Tax=Nocardia cyriacigeorgica TaxID=135487 RepID=A0A5R8PIC6_9NOCA|nr:hypothetical protein [Nocardia cyriacigeorgica]TLG14927.1 hypothetical protein FEK35_07205 [Nocardia cyriacigeorgica]
MTDDRVSSEQNRHFPFGLALAGVIPGVATAFVGAAILGRSWNACDIGTNSANTITLLWMYIPALTVVASAWWGTVFVVAARRSGTALVRVLGATFVGLLGALILVWGLMGWRHNPGGDYPATVCTPDNVPPWWPTWLPL